MADAAKQEPVVTMWSKEFTYDRWMKSKGIPIHRGYFIEDLRTIELEWWEERGCKAAFIQLLGQEGVSAAHLKISDHSWHNTASLTPLLPVGRILGKVTIAVLSSE